MCSSDLILPTLQSNESVRQELVYHAANGKLGLRQGSWTYLRRGGISSEPEWFKKLWGGDPIETQNLLFDLSNDLGQRQNLYKKFPERTKQMEAQLTKILNGKSTR